MLVDTTAPRTSTLCDGRALRVRPASVADAAAVVALDRTLAAAGDGMVISLDQIRSADDEARRIDAMYREWSAGSATLLAVAELLAPATRLVGTAELRQLVPARCSHVGVLSVGVDPGARRVGVARALLDYLVAHAAAFGLERLELYVRADNAPARALYEQLGFRHEATRARFVKLEDGRAIDDLVLVRFLP